MCLCLEKSISEHFMRVNVSKLFIIKIIGLIYIVISRWLHAISQNNGSTIGYQKCIFILLFVADKVHTYYET